ncbi:MAG: response regulator [bacterium]
MTTARARQQANRRLCILVVDDDPDWLEFTTNALASCYEVVTASNGRDGVRIAREMPLAAVILDVLMSGGEDGFSVLCELRKDPLTQHLPVIFFSNVNEVTQLSFTADEIHSQLGLGPDAFLEKPSSAKAVRQTVETAVAKKRSERRASDR